MRAIKKCEKANRPVTFNNVANYMPDETRNYVPKLQAVKNIIANPERYRVTLPTIENEPYFVTITHNRDIDVSVAAKLAEMSVDDFRALNSQFGSYVITGGKTAQILLPKENVKKFQQNLARWTEPLSSWTAYRVTDSREKVETIAAKFNTNENVISQANKITAGKVLKFGSTILVQKTGTERHDIGQDVIENATIAFANAYPSYKVVKVPVRQQANVESDAKR